MRLTLSHSSHINSLYRNENGQVIYKVHSGSPFKLIGRTSTISRILPNDIPSRDGVIMEDRFAHLGQIKWNNISPSRIRFRGHDADVHTFFQKGRLKWPGRDRIFTAPDGREYRWVLGSASALYTNNEAKTPVARFHQSHIGVFRKARKASLEIFPAGEHIVDAILVTFVYIEQLRDE